MTGMKHGHDVEEYCRGCSRVMDGMQQSQGWDVAESWMGCSRVMDGM